ncbi:hypothetical protein L7F22_005127 [Adiantum nelumboides]|nr:hypothetical protein [Adiantum nelumboides]
MQSAPGRLPFSASGELPSSQTDPALPGCICSSCPRLGAAWLYSPWLRPPFKLFIWRSLPATAFALAGCEASPQAVPNLLLVQLVAARNPYSPVAVGMMLADVCGATIVSEPVRVTKLLASLYSSKIEADAVDDAANNDRQSCSEFVYDFMLNLYGLKGIAESAIHGLFKTIKSLITSKQMDKHHKVTIVPYSALRLVLVPGLLDPTNNVYLEQANQEHAEALWGKAAREPDFYVDLDGGHEGKNHATPPKNNITMAALGHLAVVIVVMVEVAMVRLFSKFVGLEGESFVETDLYLYLKLLQKGVTKPCAILPSDQDDGLIYMNFPYVDYILDEPNLIEFVGSEVAARDIVTKFASKFLITEKASPEIKKLVKENEVKKLDWDHLVETILESRPRTQVQEKRESVRKSVHQRPPLTEEKLQELVNLFIAGDANQDGVLTFTEFREIISTAEPSISTQSALRMFRETLLLMPDGGDSISPQAFAKIAHEHGISAPPAVVFDLLKKTWSQVQSDVIEEKMQEDSQRREFENLKNTLLSLLAEQKKVTEAVQVFRDLVLKFCGSEEEGEDADQENNGTSEAEDMDLSQV